MATKTRTYLGAELMNTPSALAGPAARLQKGPYYSISAIFLSRNEFGTVTDAIGLEDLNRLGAAKDSIHRLLLNLIVATPQYEGSDNQDCFFISIPKIGYCLLICCKSKKFLNAWCFELKKLVEGKNAHAVRSMKDMGKDARITTATQLVTAINTTFHPSNQTSFLKQDLYTSLADIMDSFTFLDMYGQAHDDAVPNAHGDAAAENAAAQNQQHITQHVVSTMPPKYMMNPLLATSIHRVLTVGFLAGIDDSLLPLVASNPEGIFCGQGIIDFRRLPNTWEVYHTNLPLISKSHFFPGVLPDRARLIQLYTEMNAHNVVNAIASIRDDKELARAIKTHRVIAPENVALFNPVERFGSISEAFVAGSYNAPYLSETAKALSEARKHMTIEDYRSMFVSDVAKCISRMSTSPDCTPIVLQQAANIVLDGLHKHGLHFVQPKDRPSDWNAYVAYILRIQEEMNTTRHHTSIGFRMIISVLTTHISNHGGFHLCITGLPADGKTYTINTLMKYIFPTMISALSFSDQALCSSDAMRHMHNTLFADEANRNTFDPKVLKQVAGRQTQMQRMQNTDFRTGESAKGSGQYPVCAVVIASNFPADEIFSGDQDFTSKSSRMRTASEARSDFRQDSSSGSNTDVGIQSLRSRFTCVTLDAIKVPLTKLLREIDDATDKHKIEEAAEPLKYMINISIIVCTLIREGIIPLPVSFIRDTMIEEMETFALREKIPMRKTDTRTAAQISATAQVAAVLEQVYERCIQGGEHVHGVGASVTKLAEIIFDIATSLVPTIGNIVFGAGMVFDNLQSEKDEAQFPRALLHALDAAEIVCSDNWYTLRSTDIGKYAIAMEITPDCLTQKLRGLANVDKKQVKVVGDEGDVQRFEPAVRQMPDAGGWKINIHYLRTAISSDIAFDATLINCATSGEWKAEQATTNQTLSITYDEFVTKFFEEYKKHPSMRKVPDDLIADSAVDYLMHRINLRLVTPVGTKGQVTWFRAVSSKDLLGHKNHIYSSCTYQLTPVYLQIMRQSDQSRNAVYRQFRSVLTTPGTYPLCMPQAFDKRLPAFIEVQDCHAIHDRALAEYQQATALLNDAETRVHEANAVVKAKKQEHCDTAEINKFRAIREAAKTELESLHDDIEYAKMKLDDSTKEVTAMMNRKKAFSFELVDGKETKVFGYEDGDMKAANRDALMVRGINLGYVLETAAQKADFMQKFSIQQFIRNTNIDPQHPPCAYKDITLDKATRKREATTPAARESTLDHMSKKSRQLKEQAAAQVHAAQIAANDEADNFDGDDDDEDFGINGADLHHGGDDEDDGYNFGLVAQDNAAHHPQAAMPMADSPQSDQRLLSSQEEVDRDRDVPGAPGSAKIPQRAQRHPSMLAKGSAGSKKATHSDRHPHRAALQGTSDTAEHRRQVLEAASCAQPHESPPSSPPKHRRRIKRPQAEDDDEDGLDDMNDDSFLPETKISHPQKRPRAQGTAEP